MVAGNYVRQYDADVVVFGAGPAGIAAAYQAGKDGKKVYLVDIATKVGGVMSTCPGMMLGAGYPLKKTIGGFFEEFTQRMYNMEPPVARRHICTLENFGDEVVYDHEYGISTIYEMLQEANVNLLMKHIPLNVIMDGKTIKSVELATTEGISLISSKTFIDCTGNGDIADKAGVPSQLGNDEGLMMGATLTFGLENVDWDKAFENSADPYFEEYAKRGIAEGKIDKSIPQIYMIKGFRDGTVFFNTVTVTGVDGTDPTSITQGTCLARRRVFELAKFCKEEMPGFENSHVAFVGPMLGIRETRKLEGMYKLTYNDIFKQTKFDDGIVACDNPLDEVFRDENTTHYSHEAALEQGYYTIPLRALIAKDVKNLLFAGRDMSVDAKAFASVRGMPQCMLMGQAVAVAAVQSIEDDCAVQDVDSKKVVNRMVELGVNGIAGNEL